MNNMDLLMAIGDISDDIVSAAEEKQQKDRAAERERMVSEKRHTDIRWEDLKPTALSAENKKRKALLPGLLALAAVAVIAVVIIKLIPSLKNPAANVPQTDVSAASDNTDTEVQTGLLTEEEIRRMEALYGRSSDDVLKEKDLTEDHIDHRDGPGDSMWYLSEKRMIAGEPYDEILLFDAVRGPFYGEAFYQAEISELDAAMLKELCESTVKMYGEPSTYTGTRNRLSEELTKEDAFSQGISWYEDWTVGSDTDLRIEATVLEGRMRVTIQYRMHANEDRLQFNSDVQGSNADDTAKNTETAGTNNEIEKETAGVGEGEVKETSELDQRFEEDRLIMTEAVNDPADMLSDEKYEELKDSIDEENLNVEIISRSPAGDSGFASVNDLLYVYYAGMFQQPYLSVNRGVKDTYGNLNAWFRKLSEQPQNIIGKAGVCYSPDGRYAAVFDSNTTRTGINFTQDPVIIDLSSGEMILTETFPSELSEKDAGAPVTGVFSSDCKYYYYILYGRFDDAQNRLYRYDLSEETTELCLSFEENVWYPHLSELADGSLIVLNDSANSTDTTGIIRIWYENGKWQKKQQDHTLPLRYFHPSRLDYSAASGYAVMTGAYETENWPFYYGFQAFLPDQDFEGLDRYLCIEAETNAVRSLTPEDYRMVYEKYVEAVRDPDNEEQIHTNGSMSLFPYQLISEITLSPDGKYLLLCTSDRTHDLSGGTWKLLLVRLEDLEVRNVTGINAEELMVNSSGMYGASDELMEWNSDLLIMSMVSVTGGIRAFTFAADSQENDR